MLSYDSKIFIVFNTSTSLREHKCLAILSLFYDYSVNGSKKLWFGQDLSDCAQVVLLYDYFLSSVIEKRPRAVGYSRCDKMYTINIKAAEKAKKMVLKYGHIIFSIYPEVCVIFYYAQIIKSCNGV